MMSYRMLQLMDGCTILFRFRSAYPSSATRNDLPAFRIRLIQPCDHEQIAPRMTQAAPRERAGREACGNRGHAVRLAMNFSSSPSSQNPTGQNRKGGVKGQR